MFILNLQGCKEMWYRISRGYRKTEGNMFKFGVLSYTMGMV